jgi:hypothetical protein
MDIETEFLDIVRNCGYEPKISFLEVWEDPAGEKVAARLNLMPHGIALGRGNIYTYRNAHYSMSTAVCKSVDMCGAQDHEWSASIAEELSLFTTHPAGDGNGRYGASPGYWVGNGRLPMSVQNENVNVTIYKIPKKKRLGENAVASMTHAYMPRDFYDELELDGNRVFARKNGVFVAVFSPMSRKVCRNVLYVELVENIGGLQNIYARSSVGKNGGVVHRPYGVFHIAANGRIHLCHRKGCSLFGRKIVLHRIDPLFGKEK